MKGKVMNGKRCQSGINEMYGILAIDIPSNVYHSVLIV